MRFTIALESQPEGGFVAQCIEIPGAVTQGETEEEAMANIEDAILGILEVRREQALQSRARLRTLDLDAEAAT